MDKAKKQKQSSILLVFLTVIIPAALLFMPLYIWKQLYPYRDVACAVMILLCPFLFRGRRLLAFAIYRARINVVIRKTSWLRNWLTGNLSSILSGTAFMIVATILMAYQALVSDPKESMIMILLCIVASMVFLILQSKALSHLYRPFANMGAIGISTWACTVLFIIPIIWVNLGNISSGINEMDTTKTINQILLEHIDKNIPQRRGVIAEGLVLFYAYEAFKFWIIAQIGAPLWGKILLSIDAALVSFILTRSGITLTMFVQTLFAKGWNNKNFSYEENIYKNMGSNSTLTYSRVNKAAFYSIIVYISMMMGAIIVLTALTSSLNEPPRGKDTLVEKFIKKSDNITLAAEKEWQTKFDGFFNRHALPEAKKRAREAVLGQIDHVLDDIYDPVLDEIPGFSKHYYSKYGEYIKPEGAVLESIIEDINARLYHGFDQRFSGSEKGFNDAYSAAFKVGLTDIVLAEYPVSTRNQILLRFIEGTTKSRINKAVRDAQPLVDIPTVTPSAESIINQMTEKMIARGSAPNPAIERSIGGKNVAGIVVPDRKGRGVFCPQKRWDWVPGCGEKWGRVTDGEKIFVKIGEYFRQDEFEAELRALIDQDKAAKRELLMKAFGKGN